MIASSLLPHPTTSSYAGNSARFQYNFERLDEELSVLLSISAKQKLIHEPTPSSSC
ncbi:hypothetical protein PGT21_031457 [Puccinia graminis f. sp. tritici]|uniref:Uncharacterized protein n=1 Tax=Puccinia graminis f. sp. tritici TaxID=56615 RepID=A0A5B0NDP7_PUCGR|nr:hypothetical protein PGT21_031457 [Puccinia graminis f. sp. tritici]